MRHPENHGTLSSSELALVALPARLHLGHELRGNLEDDGFEQIIDIKRSVSRRHARISTRDGVYFLTEEVGALNGTFVNGVKLITGKPAPLNNEDRVSLGTVNLVFRS